MRALKRYGIRSPYDMRGRFFNVADLLNRLEIETRSWKQPRARDIDDFDVKNRPHNESLVRDLATGAFVAVSALSSARAQARVTSSLRSPAPSSATAGADR